jgi:hypothetical protein
MTTKSQDDNQGGSRQGQVFLSDAARANLEGVTEMWRAESEWVKLEYDDGGRVLQFDAEKMKPIEGRFGPQVRYFVIDPNYPGMEKKIDTSRKLSEQINNTLRAAGGKCSLLIAKTKDSKGSVVYEVKKVKLPA